MKTKMGETVFTSYLYTFSFLNHVAMHPIKKNK